MGTTPMGYLHISFYHRWLLHRNFVDIMDSTLLSPCMNWYKGKLCGGYLKPRCYSLSLEESILLFFTAS